MAGCFDVKLNNEFKWQNLLGIMFLCFLWCGCYFLRRSAVHLLMIQRFVMEKGKHCLTDA